MRLRQIDPQESDRGPARSPVYASCNGANRRSSTTVKSFALISGVPPESTILYYRAIIRNYRAQLTSDGNPPILINCIEPETAPQYASPGGSETFTGYLLQEIGKVARAGADIALFASDTAHLVFDKLEERSPIPLVSSIKASADAVARRGLRRVALFSTRSSAVANMYQRLFAEQGIAVIIPDRHQQNYIQSKYLTEPLPSPDASMTCGLFIRIAQDLKLTHNIEGVICGGGELLNVLGTGAFRKSSIPFFDSVDIHAAAFVAAIRASGVF